MIILVKKTFRSSHMSKSPHIVPSIFLTVQKSVQNDIFLHRQPLFKAQIIQVTNEQMLYIAWRLTIDFNTVNSRYPEFQGTLWNTSRYLYLDISDFHN